LFARSASGAILMCRADLGDAEMKPMCRTIKLQQDEIDQMPAQGCDEGPHSRRGGGGVARVAIYRARLLAPDRLRANARSDGSTDNAPTPPTAHRIES
jgi:hypothetical protein